MSAPGRKILVVEDENIVAMDLRMSLTGLGYQVTGTVGTGSEALDSARRRRPDLVLMDTRAREAAARASGARGRREAAPLDPIPGRGGRTALGHSRRQGHAAVARAAGGAAARGLGHRPLQGRRRGPNSVDPPRSRQGRDGARMAVPPSPARGLRARICPGHPHGAAGSALRDQRRRPEGCFSGRGQPDSVARARAEITNLRAADDPRFDGGCAHPVERGVWPHLHRGGPRACHGIHQALLDGAGKRRAVPEGAGGDCPPRRVPFHRFTRAANAPHLDAPERRGTRARSGAVRGYQSLASRRAGWPFRWRRPISRSWPGKSPDDSSNPPARAARRCRSVLPNGCLASGIRFASIKS